MKPSSPPPRTPSKLSESVRHQLNSYALAAGAAGVSLLALAGPAEAKIVYTPVHRVIGNGESYKLDFNHDGITDLTVRNVAATGCSSEGGCGWPIELLGVVLPGSNQVVVNTWGAVAMKAGMRIGRSCALIGGAVRMVWDFGYYTTFALGSWVNVKNRYLGVRFMIKGKVHYGWARLNVRVRPRRHIAAALTGYAYETVANKAIIAGRTKGPDVITVQPDIGRGSLGRLAMGRR